MAKTGSGSQLGTAEGAIMGRALHAMHAEDPVLADDWAIELLHPDTRAAVLASEDPRTMEATPGFDASPVFAVGVGCLRWAEDEVVQCAANGIDQYVILGAGFDTFALRRGNLAEGFRVYEVDHPDTQALKRERIDAVRRKPAALPTFVPVDFETTRVSEALPASGYDASRPAVLSWLNTLPYLSEEATAATLADLASLCAPESRLIVNYAPRVPLTRAQEAFMAKLREVTRAVGEPQRSQWVPDRFVALLADHGFAVLEHATEDDLDTRYFEGRTDGLRPGVPMRLVVAERRP